MENGLSDPTFPHFSGLAHGKWAPRPTGFSSFPSPAHENQAPSPNFSSSPHPAHENQSHSPSKARFSSLCKPFFTRHALQRSSKRIPLRLRRIDQYLPAPPHSLPTPHAADRWLPVRFCPISSSSAGFPPDPAGCPHRNPDRQNSRTRSRIRSYLQRRATAH